MRLRGKQMSETIDTIFISHSHDDQVYVEELVKIIQVTNVKDVEIVCTSVKGHGEIGRAHV